jgi:hypothetical protein
MKEVFKDLGITLKGEKSEFHFLSDEDLKKCKAKKRWIGHCYFLVFF